MNAPRALPFHIDSLRTTTSVMVLVADGVSLTTVSATLEPFQLANTLLGRGGFELQLVSLSDTDPVTQAGVPVPCPISSRDVSEHRNVRYRPDLVILCCGQTVKPQDHDLLEEFVRKLARMSVPVFALGAACAAVAVAGMIRGGKCAAHWKTIAPLGEQFPEVSFLNVLFEYDGLATSCAGELGAFDLVVDFIELSCGPRIAGEICNHFLASGRRSGGSVQLLCGDAVICEDETFQRAIKIMVDNIEDPISTAKLAQKLGRSTRQIERIFARSGFESPKKYYNKLRLNRARQLLEQTKMSVIEIGVACGYASQTSFSRSYKKTFGISPKVFRERMQFFVVSHESVS